LGTWSSKVGYVHKLLRFCGLRGPNGNEEEETVEERETDIARVHIDQQGIARAEAAAYSLSNSYLTDNEKAQVEAVFQFPLGAFGFTFGVVALALGQGFGMSYAIAAAVSVIAWIGARYLPGRLFYYPGFLFAGMMGTVISLGFVAWALVESRWWVAGFTAANALGIAAVAMPPIYLWTMSSPRLHAKYAIAKRMFGIRFPFESDLRV